MFSPNLGVAELFSVNQQTVNIESHSLCCNQFCHCSAKVAIDNTDNTQINRCGCVPIKLNLWKLKFEFHAIFKWHKYYSNFDFLFNHFVKQKQS